MTLTYRQFLEAKAVQAPEAGFPSTHFTVPEVLLPHQRLLVEWMVRGGRRGNFAAFGLGKTLMQLAALQIVSRLTDRPVLAVAPLGVIVSGDFQADAARLDLPLYVIRADDDLDAHATGVHLTHYESVREGKIDVRRFVAVSLDEAAILRGMGGTKTFREFMRLFADTPYRFVATATPSPNEYEELLCYAAFLGIMDIGEAKTRFFQRNSEKADQLTLHPHKEEEFWLWLSSWGAFVQRPSDLGCPDAGYDLPPLTVNWHVVTPSDDTPQVDANGQSRFLRDASTGVLEAAAETRHSLDARIAKVAALVAERPADHVLLWHHLEDERRALERAIPTCRAVYGAQPLDEREARIRAFATGDLGALAAKPVMLGSGPNLQRHCHWAIFAGVGLKFNEFIQALHRIYRFLQTEAVTIDIVHSDAQSEVVRELQRRWAQYREMMAHLSLMVRTMGLGGAAAQERLQRSLGVTRTEHAGDGFRAILNDCVDETVALPEGSVHCIVTSIPFGTQYEYTPSYHDFGHTDDDAHFLRQMDFLSPALHRALAPGRVLAVHVKDRIRPGGLDGTGFQTVSPFHAHVILHFQRHGFWYNGMVTVVTDVVRENNQTYRLGWTEQCKDGSRMSVGLPEYVLLFRKLPSTQGTGYADVRVEKPKADYSRARWQQDAHAFWRSRGDRLLTGDELKGLAPDDVFQQYRAFSVATTYDHERHVAIGETLEAARRLPPGFMLLQPQSWHEDVWTDVARMRSLNTLQATQGKEQHLCPLPFDIVDRLITRFSNRGETVFDPFAGLFTVPLRAMELGRVGVGCELSPSYFADGVAHLRAAEAKRAAPSLLDLLDQEAA